MTAPIPPVAARMAGRASFVPADRQDARRGAPAVDLTGYAASRGLQYLGSQNPSGYFAALPLEPELQFNVVRGDVGDRDVCLWHWRYAWPLDSDDEPAGDHTFWFVTVAPPMRRLWSAPRRFLSSTEADHLFIGVPCTGAAALVPEAALLPRFRITNRSPGLWPSSAEIPLAPVGLPGLTLIAESELPEGLVERLVAGPMAAVLRAGADLPFFELGYRFGTVRLVRNSYLGDATELDRLLHATRDAADALAAACRPLHRPQAFGEPLPAPPPAGPGSPRIPPALLAAVQAEAAGRGLAAEDPRAYAAAFPTNPVPGTAWAVLRGALPGLPPTARLALHTEARVVERNSGRTALLLPAGNAAPTPRGGIPVDSPSDPMRYAVRDGVFAVWILRWRPLDLGDVPTLLWRGGALAREVGALRS
ncbi:hypothetical protein [Trujillonella endophytica]|uniref:Uncharacterized protein n=1 Tax=Trujillonella endophytica TaxID=673521 RepID=A0A1H8S9K8_9ACTN|nr:hypothetical protein [Trujillella endophytica]SEO75206.1 hypothetical protein SAMN05660991_01524 [Trujillella endophytica]